MSLNKISILVKNQLPDFIVEDNPRFLAFLEAYYEFLDNFYFGTVDKIENATDIDLYLDEFESYFYNSIIPYLPTETKINKEFLFKNILPLYQAKGSEKSFTYLFRLLFDESISIENPGDRVLKASSGKWLQENILRTFPVIYSKYVVENSNIFYLPDEYSTDEFRVYINDVLTDNIILLKETKKIIINSSLNNNDIVKIYYDSFNPALLINRQFTGMSSGSKVLVERAGIRRDAGYTKFEFIIDEKTKKGNFINGESVYCDVIIDNHIIPLYLELFSDLNTINVINGGSKYNIGDRVIIKGPSEKDAFAIVDNVTSGTIESLRLIEGGAGFSVGDIVSANGFSNTYFNSNVTTVDATGQYSANTIRYNTDIIGNYSSVMINAADYGFTAGVDNINSTIANVLNMTILSGLGEITSVAVYHSSISSNTSPTIDVIPRKITANLTVRDLGAIGKINIIDGGVNYTVGEKILFINDYYFGGQGANAYVGSVNASGSITSVKVIDGGMGYKKEYFPKVSIASVSGSNAKLEVFNIMGDGEILIPELSDDVAGKILSIKVLDHGSGYTDPPYIDLTLAGDGKALANSTVRGSFVTLDGRWKDSDGMLSSEYIVLQGEDYYIDFSYVISSKVEFDRYKSIIKNVLHPAGSVCYSNYIIDTSIDSNIFTDIDSIINKDITGTINTSNGSVIITGTNTYFNVANSLGVIHIGSKVLIGNIVKTIVSIQSNTSATLNTAFSMNLTNQIISII